LKPTIEYIEGPKATENFEKGMKALFKVPKDDVVRAKKRKKRNTSRASSVRNGFLPVVEAPCHLVQVGREMLCADLVPRPMTPRLSKGFVW